MCVLRAEAREAINMGNNEHAHCPLCGKELEADYVDIGIGMEKVSPYWCEYCTYVEPGCPQEKCGGTICHSYDVCGGRSFTNTKSPVYPKR